MKRTLIGIFVVLSCIVSLSYAQETRVIATRAVPIYCLAPHYRHYYDSSCVKGFRITFQNSNDMRIHGVKFYLKIQDIGQDTSIIYNVKHEISLFMNPGETYSTDIELVNPISPPEGEHSFENTGTWKWQITIISLR